MVAIVADPFIGSLASGIPSQLHMRNYREFIEAVGRRGGNNATAAGVIIQNLIINTLQKKVNIPGASPEVRDTLVKRLKYFKSPVFLKNFTAAVPARTRWEQSIKATSYSDWLDTLFNVSFGSWRDEDLIRPSNQQQCVGSLGELSRDVHQLQDTPPPRICYLCGRAIQPGEPTMECEHVLPVITALSHIWLAQERIATYTNEERKILRLEYAWSHKCCNRFKSNYDFIVLANQRYIVNQPLITKFSEAVNAAEDANDCDQIIEVPKFLPDENRGEKKNKLIPRITEILQVINKNVANFNNIDLYLLWTKYKILFALTNQSFLNAITGDGSIATATPVFRDAARIAAKRAREAEVAAEEAAFWEAKKAGPARREAKRLAAEAAIRQGGGGGGGGGPNHNRLVSSNIGEGDIDPNLFLVPFDEDVTFPTVLMDYIGGIDNLPEIILTLPLPDLERDLDLALGPIVPESSIDITSLPVIVTHSSNAVTVPYFGRNRHTKKSKKQTAHLKHRFMKTQMTQKSQKSNRRFTYKSNRLAIKP